MYLQYSPCWEQEKIKLLTGVISRWLATSSSDWDPPRESNREHLSHERTKGWGAEGWSGILSFAHKSLCYLPISQWRRKSNTTQKELKQFVNRAWGFPRHLAQKTQCGQNPWVNLEADWALLIHASEASSETSKRLILTKSWSFLIIVQQRREEGDGEMSISSKWFTPSNPIDKHFT